jgi:SET domain-containing protein
LEKIHLTKEEQQIYHKKAAFHATRNYSLLIDAIKKGNFTRYINHSEEPNVVAALCRIPAKNSYGLSKAAIEVIYFSKKIIRPGEQLLVSYEDGEKSYWKASKIKPFVMTPKTFRLSPSLKLIVS